ncbi:MAG: hypothetical protein ACWA41_12585 [Putridiphycobacter sp.]
MEKIEIPLNIGANEFIGRIILYSFHYSKSRKKIRPEAFLPSPNEKNEISTLRFQYTNEHFCKSHGMNIASRRSACDFIGLVFLKCSEITNAPIDSEFTATPNATPLGIDGNLRSTDSPIFTTDDGIPSHADIVYNFDVVQDKPMKQSFKKKVLKPLLNLTKDRFFKDMDTSKSEWIGEEINL